MFKKVIVASAVGCVALLCAACSDDVEDACKRMKEKCAGDSFVSQLDCAAVKEQYEKASDAQKEKTDKNVECVMDAETCDAIKQCGS
jgi:hypothetical protein